jgi:hypothetical protein
MHLQIKAFRRTDAHVRSNDLLADVLGALEGYNLDGVALEPNGPSVRVIPKDPGDHSAEEKLIAQMIASLEAAGLAGEERHAHTQTIDDSPGALARALEAYRGHEIESVLVLATDAGDGQVMVSTGLDTEYPEPHGSPG